MKKFINELNEKELTQVFENNKKLQNDILEDMIETEMYWISEHLKSIENSLVDWSIGVNNPNYLKVDKNRYYEFIQGIKDIQRDFCFLCDDEDIFINLIENKINELNELEMYTNKYHELEKEIEEEIEVLSKKMIGQWKSNLNALFNKKNQLSYFLEFYADIRLSENCYIITSENSFTLYEDIFYSVNYAG